MFIPNAMLSRIIRGIVAESPHQVARIRAVSPAGAVATSAYAYQARRGSPSRRDRSPETPLDEDTAASLVEMKAVDAELTVRAMIAAAAADGEIDGREKGRILGYLADAGGTPAEFAYVEAEMRHPATPAELAQHVASPEAAAEIYAAALLATEAATPGGREFLARLAQALNLSGGFVAELHESWGDPAPATIDAAQRRLPPSD